MSIPNSSLRGYAQRLRSALDTVAEAQEDVKTIKAEAKLEGHDLKALGRVVREMGFDAEKMADQLQFELVIDTYRREVGVVTDLEKAQRAVRDEASGIFDPDAPDPDVEVFGENDTVQFGDSAPIKARDFAKAAKAAKSRRKEHA